MKLLFPKCNENSSSMFSMEETEAAADNINNLNIELWLHNNNILKLGADILGIRLFKSIGIACLKNVLNLIQSFSELPNYLNSYVKKKGRVGEVSRMKIDLKKLT